MRRRTGKGTAVSVWVTIVACGVLLAITVAGAVPCTEDSECTNGEFATASDRGPCEKIWCNTEKGHCARHYEDRGTLCRKARGVCDKAEHCTGDSAECPPDEKSTTVCRFQRGVCDKREYCDGEHDHCPDDELAPSTQVCRHAADECDEAEYCTGDSLTCPSDRGVLSPHCEQQSRLRCSTSCGCPSRTSCEVAGLRCHWADGECRRRVTAATEPNGSETEASRRLAYVLERRSSIRNDDLVRHGEFSPHYGVTALCTITQADMNVWANHVYSLIKDDEEVTDHLVLLPPRSYHVSERDLDEMLGHSTSVEHVSQLMATFRDAQREMHHIFHDAPVVMRPDGAFKGGIWYMHSADHGTEKKMREVEGLMPALLGAQEADIHKHWHIVFAYPRDGWRESHNSLHAQRRINSIIEKWGRMPENITFNAPTVLTYEDITEFTPL